MLTQSPLLRAVMACEFRATRTAPLFGCTVLFLAVTIAPAAFSVQLEAATAVTLLRAGTAIGILGLAFLLDNPAARSTEVTPVPGWMRHLTRAAIGLAVLVPSWAIGAAALVHSASDGTGPLPVANLAGETATLATVCYALMLLGLRRTAGMTGSVIAAPGVIILVIVLLSLPDAAAFYTEPAGSGWEAAQWRWRVLGIAALAACAVQAGRGPSLRRPRPISTRARTASARE